MAPLQLGTPARYQIKIQGRLDESWSDWFDDLEVEITSGENGITQTVLTGMVSDQVALHGLLARIRDLGLPLLTVKCLNQKTNK